MSDGREAYWDPIRWRLPTNEELIAYNQRMFQQGGGKKKGARGGALIVRSRLNTLDVYTYLKGRFGQPNGLQTFVAKDDSDNLFHWDYTLRADGYDLHFIGGSREVHIWTQLHLKDEEWLRLIEALKADYKREAEAKSAARQGLEKWLVFNNKFALIADRCADKHALITDQMGKFGDVTPTSKGFKTREAKRVSTRANELFGACLELRLLTPVMAEAFVNMLILFTCKEEVKADRRLHDAFIRANIDVKVADLFYKCRFFTKAPSSRDSEFAAFMTVWNKRADTLHGNVDPERDKFETVYFDGKRPMYSTGGDPIARFYETLEEVHDPAAAVADYEVVHAFTEYLLGCVDHRVRDELRALLHTSQPGWRAETKRFGSLFPDHFAAAHFGIRYDDELVT